MSRYSGDNPPRGPERWDRSRFEAATARGGPPVMERDRYEEVDYYSGRRRESADQSRRGDREFVYKEEERYDFEPRRGSRGMPRRFYEEERDTYEGALVHRPREQSRERERDRGFEIDIREREYEREPPRPRFVRRQSSLDTYDRKPMPRYGDRVKEETIIIPAGGRSRRHSPPRYHSPPRFEERDTYEDIRVAEPEYYGDDGYRGYREREISRFRRNKHEDTEEIVEEEVVEEKEFPRRGKTKMPMRLVEKSVIIELGYPFEEEGETIIILKALGKEHIDEVIKRSKEVKKSGTIIEKERTTYIYEKDSPTPPPPPPQESRVVERRTEIIREGSPSHDVPASVRDWDQMTMSKKSHKSKSRRSSSVSSSSSSSTDRKSSHHHRHHSSHRRSSHHHVRSRSAVSSKREIILTEDRDESATIRAGIGALVIPGRDRRSSKSIQREIRELEAEKRALQLERTSDDLRGEGRRGEIIIAREKDDVVEVRKDKKGRMSLVR